MMLPSGSLIPKDPNVSNLPKGMDWTDYLAEIGPSEQISASTWLITDGPDTVLTLASPSIVTGSLKTQVKLSAGTLGGIYTVTNRISTTPSGITDEDRSFDVKIEEQ